jgi:hypothetical protein
MNQIKSRSWILWTISVLVLGLFFIGNYIFFGVSDTPYEQRIRSFISSSLRSALALDTNDFQNPVVANQTFLISSPLIAMSSQLVYESGENIVIFVQSENDGKIELSTVTESKITKVNNYYFSKNQISTWTTVNSLGGFNLSEFSEVEIHPPVGYSGWLQATVTSNDHKRNVPVFIDSIRTSTENPNKAEALFVENTFTLKAYNSANGLRNNYSNQYNLKENFSRPTAYPMDYELVPPMGDSGSSSSNSQTKESSSVRCSDHLANANFALKGALLDLGLDFDLASDEAITNAPIPDGYKLLIFGAHEEYWSSEMFSHVEQFVSKGGSVLFLGGNNAWRFVEDSSESFEIYWGNGVKTPQQQKFVDEILGTYWDMRGYNTFAPFETRDDISKLVPELAAGTKFGETNLENGCSQFVAGMSGSETDKLRPTSNSGFEVIATGKNPWMGGADVVTRKTVSGGYLLNFSSTGTWLGSSDRTFQSILKSYLNKALK